MIPSTAVPRLIRNCRLSPTSGQPGNEGTLLVPEGILRLKGAALEVIRLCDGKRTLDEILRELAKKFSAEAPESLQRETESFLERLREKRVVDF